MFAVRIRPRPATILRHRLPHSAIWIGGLWGVLGCGSATGTDLFLPGGSQPSVQDQTGGSNPMQFGAGGSPSGTGAGGISLGSGGAGNGGRGLVTGGGGAAGDQGTGGHGDGGGNPSSCDFSGTWGSYLVVPVTWPASPLVLFAGNGNLQQWNLSAEHMVGNDVTAVTVPCGIFLPDLQSDFFGGYAKFGIRFPDSLFDVGAIPTTTFVLKGHVTPTGLTFETDPFAILLGVTLDNPTTAPWPAVASLKLVDADLDGKPGITVVPATGAGYTLPPSDPAGGQADLIYIADRTVSSLSGAAVNCNEVHGDVNIVVVDGMAPLPSTVVGCHKMSGGECSASDAAFIDSNRPEYKPSAPGTMVSVRLPAGSTCKDVRNRFPTQTP